MFKLKRVYEKPSRQDGFRVLVERLWPRGVSKKRAALDLWLKDIAPSPQLRKWYAHDPAKWIEFRRRYAAELRKRSKPVKLLKSRERMQLVTLVYAAKDENHSGALALKSILSRNRRS